MLNDSVKTQFGDPNDSLASTVRSTLLSDVVSSGGSGGAKLGNGNLVSKLALPACEIGRSDLADEDTNPFTVQLRANPSPWVPAVTTPENPKGVEIRKNEEKPVLGLHKFFDEDYETNLMKIIGQQIGGANVLTDLEAQKKEHLLKGSTGELYKPKHEDYWHASNEVGDMSDFIGKNSKAYSRDPERLTAALATLEKRIDENWKSPKMRHECISGKPSDSDQRDRMRQMVENAALIKLGVAQQLHATKPEEAKALISGKGCNVNDLIIIATVCGANPKNLEQLKKQASLEGKKDEAPKLEEKKIPDVKKNDDDFGKREAEQILKNLQDIRYRALTGDRNLSAADQKEITEILQRHDLKVLKVLEDSLKQMEKTSGVVITLSNPQESLGDRPTASKTLEVIARQLEVMQLIETHRKSAASQQPKPLPSSKKD